MPTDIHMTWSIRGLNLMVKKDGHYSEYSPKKLSIKVSVIWLCHANECLTICMHLQAQKSCPWNFSFLYTEMSIIYNMKKALRRNTSSNSSNSSERINYTIYHIGLVPAPLYVGKSNMHQRYGLSECSFATKTNLSIAINTHCKEILEVTLLDNEGANIVLCYLKNGKVPCFTSVNSQYNMWMLNITL